MIPIEVVMMIEFAGRSCGCAHSSQDLFSPVRVDQAASCMSAALE